MYLSLLPLKEEFSFYQKFLGSKKKKKNLGSLDYGEKVDKSDTNDILNWNGIVRIMNRYQWPYADDKT